MIKLYGIPASRAFRSLWALEEIGLEYERVPVHYIGDSKKPEDIARATMTLIEVPSAASSGKRYGPDTGFSDC